MELIIFLLGLLGSALWCIILAYVYSGRADRKLAERKRNKQLKKQHVYEELSKKGNFRKITLVKGILNVNGKDIHTYDTGDLIIDNTVCIRFFAFETVRITDIFFCSNNKSIFDNPTKRLSEQEITVYIFKILNQFEREGKIREKTIKKIVKIFGEVKELNELIHKGRIKRDNNEEETYICCY